MRGIVRVLLIIGAVFSLSGDCSDRPCNWRCHLHARFRPKRLRDCALPLTHLSSTDFSVSAEEYVPTSSRCGKESLCKGWQLLGIGQRASGVLILRGGQTPGNPIAPHCGGHNTERVGNDYYDDLIESIVSNEAMMDVEEPSLELFTSWSALNGSSWETLHKRLSLGARCMTLSPQKTFVAAWQDAETIGLWNIKNNASVVWKHELHCPNAAAAELAFSPDEALVGTRQGGVFRQWYTHSGELAGEVDLPDGPPVRRRHIPVQIPSVHDTCGDDHALKTAQVRLCPTDDAPAFGHAR